MVKAVIFDCFGVLYGSSMWAQLELCPPDKRQELIDNNKQNDYGYLSVDEYNTNIGRLLGLTPEGVVAMMREKHVRNQPMFDMIASLRQQGIKTALLSNAGRDMPGSLFSDEELHGAVFDTYGVSSELGIAKPNPAIFAMIAERIGVSTGECVMIDDTPENCEGAEVAGMLSIQHVTNAETFNSLTKLLQPTLD